MNRRRKSNIPVVGAHEASASQSGSRRARISLPTPSHAIPPGTKEINAAPMLQHAKPGINPHGRMTVSRAIAMAGIMIHGALPALISWGMTMGLIFGGCCSNVFALEAIVKEEPKSGLLITFTQFVLTALFTWPTHFSLSRPPFFLKPPAVPILRWLPNVILFFTVNLLNNFAFGYNISVPVHIILRSGGSVTTMLVGWIWGKRYNNIQVFSVAMLTLGVVIAAMSDARSKGKTSVSSGEASTASFVVGLSILFIAQVLSAVMGIYTQHTYATYGAHWHENLFYSHFISLPLFIPFLPSLYYRFGRLINSRPLPISSLPWFPTSQDPSSWMEAPSPSSSILVKPKSSLDIEIPTHILTLALNALTQYACIRGVNLLGARTSALGVSIVLNVRKLVSLFASIWLFGNQLPPGVVLGAGVVFMSSGIYAWEGGRARGRLPENEKTNGR